MTGLAGMPLPGGHELDDTRKGDARRGGGTRWVTGAEAEILHEFLKEIGLAPGFGGMKLAKIRDKGFMWVTAEEAAAHAEEIPKLVYDQPDSTKPGEP